MMAVATAERLRFLWLEITGRCQLRCRHCYSESGPDRGHGSMRTGDWRRVLDEAADLGVSDVQFIGGEPTLHPDLPELIRHALGGGWRSRCTLARQPGLGASLGAVSLIVCAEG
ncbi:MAG: hypothetical protein QOE72_4343 [Chloroflexota bacterium]|jgi:MoaA/NifB/PqqE/SkfB family radical SAM enzyme|nr:hypothetical protein [Chloroflexota bacterium]